MDLAAKASLNRLQLNSGREDLTFQHRLKQRVDAPISAYPFLEAAIKKGNKNKILDKISEVFLFKKSFINKAHAVLWASRTSGEIDATPKK